MPFLSTPRLSPTAILSALALCLTAAVTACAEPQTKTGGAPAPAPSKTKAVEDKGHHICKTLPPNTAVAIIYDEHHHATVCDGKARKKAKKCRMCDHGMEQSLGMHCKNAPPNQGICGGLVQATIEGMDKVSVLTSRRNPHCVTIIINGQPYTIPEDCTH